MSGDDPRLRAFIDSFAPSADEAARRDALLKLSREKMAEGATQDDMILFLHVQGIDIVDATVTFKKLYGRSFAEIDSLFRAHSVWRDEIEASDEATWAFIEGFASDGDTSA